MSEQNRGKYVVLEGGDGTGKSTQAMILADNIGAQLTREPGGTDLGQHLRSILLNAVGAKRDPIVDTLMFAADRAHLANTVIKPTLNDGISVVSDRSWMSSYAYQAAAGIPKSTILKCTNIALGELMNPDLVILLDADPENAHQRLAQKGDAPDYYESKGLAYHRSIRELLLEVCEMQDGVVIDAMQPVDEISTQIMNAYRERFES